MTYAQAVARRTRVHTAPYQGVEATITTADEGTTYGVRTQDRQIGENLRNSAVASRSPASIARWAFRLGCEVAGHSTSGPGRR